MRRSWIGALLLLAACTAKTPDADAPAPPPKQRPEIVIDSVRAENPVVVSGTARTFENNVVVRVRDARGALIAETFTTSVGEMGHHNPFTASVHLIRDPGEEITVEALEYSAKDGSERSLTFVTKPFAVEPVGMTLLLPHRNPRDCSDVTAVLRTMPKSIAPARLLLEALIRDERSPFPRGSAVRSLNLGNGVLTVDFNERLQNVGGSCAALAIRASVERTLMNLPGVRRVVITAGGSRELALQP